MVGAPFCVCSTGRGTCDSRPAPILCLSGGQGQGHSLPAPSLFGQEPLEHVIAAPGLQVGAVLDLLGLIHGDLAAQVLIAHAGDHLLAVHGGGSFLWRQYPSVCTNYSTKITHCQYFGGKKWHQFINWCHKLLAYERHTCYD